ncbi:MAG: DUF3052 domain-containing protein [Bacteroidetes bacterium]|nr:DUF3052 domain-containing protein [Bacteroidota bacterium]
MSTSGYSGTPLINKLGIKPSMKVLLINKPADYYDLLGIDISKQLVKQKEIPDFIHLFAKNEKEFVTEMKTIQAIAKKNSEVIIWVSWYKKAAKIPTDITEDSIRNYALKNELVDIKVCAVSGIWSGLKLVVPKALRIA